MISLDEKKGPCARCDAVRPLMGPDFERSEPFAKPVLILIWRGTLKKRLTKARKRQRAKKPTKPAVSAAARWRDFLLSTDEAGAAVKMTGERIRQLTKLSWIRKAGTNEYRLGDVVDGVLAYRDDQVSKATADSEQSRLAAARRQEVEQRIAREDHRLIPIEDVQEGIAELIGAFRTELAGVPAALTRDLALRQQIDDALTAAVERCRARLEAMRADFAEGRDPLAEPAD